jgi:glutamine synthetase
MPAPCWVKVVPEDRFAAAARLGVGFSPVCDVWRIDGLPDREHPLAVVDGDLRLVEALDYATAPLDALDAAGLPWQQFHPEYGAAQFELSLAPADPVEAADRLVLAKLLIQRVTRRFGWQASFSPLPEAARAGNGGHVHLCLSRQGLPVLQGGDGPAGLPPAGVGLLGALLEALPALLPIGCPLAVSYRRLALSR